MRTCVENSTRFHYFLKYFMSNSALLKIIFYPLSLESSSPSSCPQPISLKKKKNHLMSPKHSLPIFTFHSNSLPQGSNLYCQHHLTDDSRGQACMLPKAAPGDPRAGGVCTPQAPMMDGLPRKSLPSQEWGSPHSFFECLSWFPLMVLSFELCSHSHQRSELTKLL